MVKSKKTQNHFKKLMSSILTLALLFAVAAVPNTMVFSAQAVTGGATMVLDTESFTFKKDGWTTNIPEIFSASSGIGVNLDFNGGDVGRTISSAVAYNPDGLSIKFDNLKKEEGGINPVRFSVILSGAQNSLSNFRMQFDTEAGILNFFNGSTYATPVTIITDEALKYANLTGKEFTLSLNSASDGDLVVTVEIEGGTTLTGEISTTICGACMPAYNAGSCYVLIAPGKNIEGFDSNAEGQGYFFSIDVTEISHDPYTIPTSSMLNYQNGGTFKSVPNGSFPKKAVCTFNGLDAGGRIPSASVYEVNGLSLRFNNLQKMAGYESENLKTAITFTETQGTIGNVRVMIDTATGELSYYKGLVDPVVIATSDLLKYENLTGKEYIVSFAVTAENDCDVTVKVGENSVTGTIPATFFANLTTPQKTYFTVAPGNQANHFTVELTGVMQGVVEEDEPGISQEEIDEIMAAIDALPEYEEITIADGPAIHNLVLRCEALSATDLEAICNHDVLLNSEAYWYELVEAENTKFTVYKNTTEHLVEPAEVVNGYWPNSFVVSTAPSNNGMRLKWVDGARNYRVGIAHTLSLDGLHLKFSRLMRADDTTSKFAVFISDNSNFTYLGSNGGLALLLDVNAGTLTYITARDDTPAIIIEDELLKYANISGLPFEIVTKERENDFAVSVIVNGQAVTGSLPKTALANVTNTLTNTDECHITLSPWDNNTNMQIDAVGYYNDTDAVSGDIDGDGIVGNTDLASYVQIIMGAKEAPEGADLDLDGDGKITLIELIRVKKYLADLIDELVY